MRKSHGRRKKKSSIRTTPVLYVIKLYRKGNFIYTDVFHDIAACDDSLPQGVHIRFLLSFIELIFHYRNAVLFIIIHSLHSFSVSKGFTIVWRLASFLITRQQNEGKKMSELSTLCTLFLLAKLVYVFFIVHMPCTDIQPTLILIHRHTIHS